MAKRSPILKRGTALPQTKVLLGLSWDVELKLKKLKLSLPGSFSPAPTCSPAASPAG